MRALTIGKFRISILEKSTINIIRRVRTRFADYPENPLFRGRRVLHFTNLSKIWVMRELSCKTWIAENRLLSAEYSIKSKLCGVEEDSRVTSHFWEASEFRALFAARNGRLHKMWPRLALRTAARGNSWKPAPPGPGPDKHCRFQVFSPNFFDLS